MKVIVKLESVMLLGANESTYTSKRTNQPVTIYDLSLKQDSQVGTIGTNAAVYNMYKSKQIQDMQMCDMYAEYNTDYRNLQVVSVHPVGK